jgi:alanine racemase
MKEIARPTWAEVDLGAVAHNVQAIQGLLQPQTKLMAIVKANGYGHGALQIARTALKHGAEYLGVATLSEGVRLREQGIEAPIIVLGFTPTDQVQEVLDYNITTTLYTLEMAEALSKAATARGERAIGHVKIDTGMGRIGFHTDKASVEVIKKIVSLPGLCVEGLFTHFSAADEEDKSYTRKQLTIFKEFISQLEQEGIHIPLKHAANSAGLIDMPETHFDMVRAGIILYGLYPSEEVQRNRIKLIPAMTLKTRVSFVKNVDAGDCISYGRKYTAQSERVIATLPIGYADGYPRSLTHKSQVLLGGRRVPTVGTICMDQLMVDVSSVPQVKIDDEAVIFGNQGQECITVEEIAGKLHTINYEIVCMLSERVPRVYINEN